MRPDAMAFVKSGREFTDEGRLRNVQMHIIILEYGRAELPLLLAKYREERKYKNSTT